MSKTSPESEALEQLIYAVKHGSKADREAAVKAGEELVGVVQGEPARSTTAKAKAEAEAKAEKNAAQSKASKG